ncbi:MAG TPA: RDD family protein [Verrucomicrobiales bacterium]|nr:RDD family protein [Verrucomicrobiales bacterium]
MQVFLAIGGEKRGPFSLYEVREMISRGEVEADTLGWFQGRLEWEPVGAMPAFDDIFVRREAQELKQETESEPVRPMPGEDAARYLPTGTVRPWVRFWARNIDECFLLLVAVAVLWMLENIGVPGISLKSFPTAWFLFLYPPWVFGEAWFLARWGATPGKMLLNVRVTRRDGGKLSYAMAWRRSLSVFVVGLGCRLPWLVFLTQAFSYVLLRRTGRTHWDRGLDLRVEHGPVEWPRVVLSLAIVLLLMTVLARPLEEVLGPGLKELGLGEEWRKALSKEGGLD